MKLILSLAFALLLSVGAQAQNKIKPAAPGVTYGKGAKATNAIAVQELPKAFKEDSVYKGQITGKVVEVCTKKGCFMKLEQADNETVMVRFTDYAYFMPQNIVGKTVVLDGTAKLTTTSVEDLQHYAKDMGKSAQEIAAIKEPKKGAEIMADGVLVIK